MADRNSFRDKAKSIWLRGMKAVGNTAASIASNTRFKVDEMTLQNRRRELLGDVAGEIAARKDLHPSFLTGEDQIRLRHSGAENQYFFHIPNTPIR